MLSRTFKIETNLTIKVKIRRETSTGFVVCHFILFLYFVFIVAFNWLACKGFQFKGGGSVKFVRAFNVLCKSCCVVRVISTQIVAEY